MLKVAVCVLGLLCCVLCEAEEQWAVPLHGRDVAIRMWRADGAKAAGVLVLVPGYNGEDPNAVDREILGLYAAFYLRRPWKIVHLLRVASLGGLAHALEGTLKSGIGRLRGAIAS